MTPPVTRHDMQQTPVHDSYNDTLLAMMPSGASKVIEFGCGSGALAREFKRVAPHCHYLGAEIDAAYAELAKRHCDDCLVLDLNTASAADFQALSDRDCWVFGDVLEHLMDPWRVLRSLRDVMPAHGTVLASIPNAQHWSVQSKLSVGDFRYVDSGLFDKTHLRWFTRDTVFDLFHGAGFQVTSARSRVFALPTDPRIMPAIRALAEASGGSPDQAEQDALAVQFVIKAHVAS